MNADHKIIRFAQRRPGPYGTPMPVEYYVLCSCGWRTLPSPGPAGNEFAQKTGERHLTEHEAEQGPS